MNSLLDRLFSLEPPHGIRITAIIGCASLVLLDPRISAARSLGHGLIRQPLPPEASFVRGGGDGIVVKLRLKCGKDLLAMVDTGCRDTILDQSLNPVLGKPLGTKKIGYPGTKRQSATVFKSPELYLGDTRLLTGSRVLTAGRGGGAILGMDCLKHYSLPLDFAAGKLRSLDQDHLQSQDLGRAYPISVSRWTGHVSLREDFMGLKGANWLVDTGACGLDGLLKPRFFEQALRDQITPAVQAAINGTPSRGAVFPKGAFGNESYTNLVFGELTSDLRQAPNVLGLRFLSRRLVTFNFPKGTMYLRRCSIGPIAE